MRVAVIPARGGSKRIPRKNVRAFAGRPMIGFAIATARACGLFEHVVVSTDDDEIADVALSLGAEVPFRRPAPLADDHTPTVPVIAHAIDACRALGWSIDLACCIYPAVPFLQPDDIRGALQLLDETGALYSFLIAEFPSRPQRGLTRDSRGFVSPMFPEAELTRTQDLPAAYYDVGQLYWGTADAWRTSPRIHSNGVGFEIPAWRAIDIDTPADWTRAERLFTTYTHPLPRQD